MRISDWSSDVCSSDLGQGAAASGRAWQAAGKGRAFRRLEGAGDRRDNRLFGSGSRGHGAGCDDAGIRCRSRFARARAAGKSAQVVEGELEGGVKKHAPFDRSEEHTSELQSLMRISYAVFCLKK